MKPKIYACLLAAAMLSVGAVHETETVYQAIALAAAMLSVGAVHAWADNVVNWVHIEANPKNVAVFDEIAKDFEATHPGTKVNVRFIENEAFKSTLPTMLRSQDPPHIFYSWGGGVLAEQVRGGVLKDLTDDFDTAWSNSLEPSAVAAFQVNGRQFGIPVRSSVVGIFYNKALFAKAGIDPTKIKTWSELLKAIADLRAAGITPIAVGGAEGWPQHFWSSFLSVRMAGHEKLNAALRGEGEGFNDPAFVAAFEKLAELGKLNPFQEGWLAASANDSYAYFGNGQAAMLLQGDWARGLQAKSSASGKGIGDDLGWMAFPQVEGGIANSTETFGGINGWILFKDAPAEAVDFVRFYSKPENQMKMIEKGTWLPPAKGIAAKVSDPWRAQVAGIIADSSYHQNFYNVMFSEQVNRELLDIVTAVLAGEKSPADGAAALQSAWEISH